MASAPYLNPFYNNFYIGTPTIAVANSFTGFVAGVTQLQPVGSMVSGSMHPARG